MADKVMDALNAIASNVESLQVKAGFIDGATYPDGTPVAMVAAVNEYGDPARNQPPRPFFRNAIAQHESEWADTIARGMEKGVDTRTILSVVGEQIAGDVVQSIATLMEPPIKDATIANRRRRGNKSVKPLVDTKVMIRDVHSEVGEIELSQDRE